MDDKIKALRLLVNDKLIYGEVSMENGLDAFDKIYVELHVCKEADKKYFFTEKHVLYNDLTVGTIYNLSLTIDGNGVLNAGEYCLSSILHSNYNDDIIILLFHHHLSPSN
jgi:hypothetical protein